MSEIKDMREMSNDADRAVVVMQECGRRLSKCQPSFNTTRSAIANIYAYSAHVQGIADGDLLCTRGFLERFRVDLRAFFG